MIDSNTICII